MSKTKGKTRARVDKIGRKMGISSQGIRLGRVAVTGSMAVLAFMPAYKDLSGVAYSIFDIMTGKGIFAPMSLSDRAANAFTVGRNLLYGYIPAGQTADRYPASKYCGFLVAGGITLEVLGKFINKYLGGSFIKL